MRTFLEGIGEAYLAKSKPEIYKEIQNIKATLGGSVKPSSGTDVRDVIEQISWHTLQISKLSIDKSSIKATSTGFFFNKDIYFGRITIDCVVENLEESLSELKSFASLSLLDIQKAEISELFSDFYKKVDEVRKSHHLEQVLVFGEGIVDEASYDEIALRGEHE